MAISPSQLNKKTSFAYLKKIRKENFKRNAFCISFGSTQSTDRVMKMTFVWQILFAAKKNLFEELSERLAKILIIINGCTRPFRFK